MPTETPTLRASGRGTTRYVVLIGSWAIKVPVFWRWGHFLRGLLGNMLERDVWRWSDLPTRRWLCPVLFALPGGWLLVMRRAEVVASLTPSERVELCRLFNDVHEDNVGRCDGQIVMVDYACQW